MKTEPDLSLDFSTLRELYASGKIRPSELIEIIYNRIEAAPQEGVWIYLRPRAEAVRAAEELEQRKGGGALPLYGLPFAVKDNIDVAGVPTTAACHEFSYVPQTSATVVSRILDAGAIFIGKTNLDQFATGLVGTRSPYGKCRNPFNADYIAGGSSSGSAFAVSAGLVSFSLGTDTAGSGRVPAGFTNIVGLKPTRGLLSTTGVVPACRSLDCVSIFALSVGDAMEATSVSAAFDETDPYSRIASANEKNLARGTEFRFGIPDALQFFGDDDAERLYKQAVEHLVALGGEPVEIHFEPFLQTAALLYGQWIAERWSGLKDFHANHAEAFHPITRKIIESGTQVSGSELFDALHRLERLKRLAAREWEKMDILLVPTTASIYTLEQIEADPIALNTNLGYYTNFVNLLDCSALAVPSGFRANGLPFGVTFIGPAWGEDFLCEAGQNFHRAIGGKLGATSIDLDQIKARPMPALLSERMISIAVVGAHLQGEPLNYQLTERGARPVKKCSTQEGYRLYALNTTPAKPGLVRTGNGAKIALEVWSMPERNFSSFLSLIAPPLCIGSVLLEDGEIVKGFLCEPYALDAAEEITQHRGWRAYRAALAAQARASASAKFET